MKFAFVVASSVRKKTLKLCTIEIEIRRRLADNVEGLPCNKLKRNFPTRFSTEFMQIFLCVFSLLSLSLSLCLSAF